ncbi:MAG: hypothetical protein CMC44_05465 [Flavobacteriaceae bacterium]|nr:hypothetical protein [Flavobacteriaceae bacterium]
MKSKLKISLFAIIFIMISCEKDDICIESQIGTPRIILSFYDKTNKTLKKPVENLLIKGIEREDTLDIFSGDSIAIPLRNNSNFSKFEFILNAGGENSNNDTIHFEYSRYDLYINRACGFKSNYILNDPPAKLFNIDSPWIEQILKLKDTILNENNAHLAIYH